MIKGHNSMVKAQPNEYNIYRLKPEYELGEGSLLHQHNLPNLSCIILYIRSTFATYPTSNTSHKCHNRKTQYAIHYLLDC